MRMKTEPACHGLKAVIRRLAATITLLLAGAWLNAAEPADFKTFASEENYVVDGVPILLRQQPGWVMVNVSPAFQPADDTGTLTATNGARFDKGQELAVRTAIYKMQSADPVNEAASREAIDSLNQDSSIEFAYPAYVNPASGLHHFLNDEIVVCLNAPLDPGQTDVLSAFKLEFIETLSAAKSIHVARLITPKEFNPFKVCHALRQRTEVVWAEPNMAQEFHKNVIPNDTLFGSQWHLRNTGQTEAFSDADVDADEAWDGSQSYGSPGIRIAILDDGVQTGHPDLN